MSIVQSLFFTLTLKPLGLIFLKIKINSCVIISSSLDWGVNVQNGQPVLFDEVLFFISACQTCSSPFGHFYHIFFSEPETKSYGVKSPFFVGCHSLAISGKTVFKQLDSETTLEEQTPHPVFDTVLFEICACQT